MIILKQSKHFPTFNPTLLQHIFHFVFKFEMQNPCNRILAIWLRFHWKPRKVKWATIMFCDEIVAWMLAADLDVFWKLEFRIVEDFQNVALETSGGGRYGCDFEENSKSQFLMRIKDSIKSNSSSPQIVEFFKKSQNSRWSKTKLLKSRFSSGIENLNFAWNFRNLLQTSCLGLF